MKTKKFSPGRLLLLALVVCVCLAFLFPLYWIVVTAVKPTTEVSVYPPTIWPSRFEWSNFAKVLSDYPILLWFRNTAIVAAVATVITIVFTVLGETGALEPVALWIMEHFAASVHIGMWIGIVLTALFIAVEFFIVKRIITRKLNLE